MITQGSNPRASRASAGKGTPDALPPTAPPSSTGGATAPAGARAPRWSRRKWPRLWSPGLAVEMHPVERDHEADAGSGDGRAARAGDEAGGGGPASPPLLPRQAADDAEVRHPRPVGPGD